MDVIQAIKERRSTRAFKPVPVPKDIVREVLALALSAPSANNLQPWEFIVMAGEEKDRLSRTLARAYRERRISCDSGAVKPLPDIFRQRGHDNLAAMRPYVKAGGVPLGTFVDEGSLNFYGAPVAIIICIDDSFSDRQMVDTGTALGYLLLAAQALSLGTCPIGLIAAYSDEIKELLNIPDNKRVVIGVALGYPDPDSPVNRFRSAREDPACFVRWID